MINFGLYFSCLAVLVNGWRMRRTPPTNQSVQESASGLSKIASGRPTVSGSSDSITRKLGAILFSAIPRVPSHHTYGRHYRDRPQRNCISRIVLSEKSDVSGSTDELNGDGAPPLKARKAREDPSISVRQCLRQLTKSFPRLDERARSIMNRLMPYSFKRRAVERMRIALFRADLSSLNREAAALEARLNNMVLKPYQEYAERARLSELRLQASTCEQNILRLTSSDGDDWCNSAVRAMETLAASQYRPITVFMSELERQPDLESGVNLLTKDVESVIRLGLNVSLVQGYLGLPRWPYLMLHSWTIFLRAERLERYAPGILQSLSQPVKGSALGGFSSRDTLSYLDLVEPHLDTILYRFDDIEPHLPFVLEHLDKLAPHCGTLLKHLDGLLLYANTGDDDDDSNITLQLLDYVPVFAPMLDVLAPHLPLIRPHLKKLMPVLPAIAPYADRFAPYVSVSANADVILWYFGWVLRIPGLRRVLVAPGMPRLAGSLAKRLPRYPVRGRNSKVECDWDGCETSYVANAKRYYETIGSDDLNTDVQTSVRATMSKKDARKAWRRYRKDRIREDVV